MRFLLKQLGSLVLPVTVLILVPLSIVPQWSWPVGVLQWCGIGLMILGLGIMTVTIGSFIVIGRGTLAPWAPTQKLVVRGLYRYVRNPMILGVLTVLLGQTLWTGSRGMAIWTILFFLINNVFFVVYEEPNLSRRFGGEYLQYKAHVPRWIPRRSAYRPAEDDDGQQKAMQDGRSDTSG